MSDRCILTTAEALSLLPEGDEVHTMVANGMWMGCDWSREAVVNHIVATVPPTLSGPIVARMGHGLCLDPNRRLFAATDAAALQALEATIADESDEDAERVIADLARKWPGWGIGGAG